MKFLLFTITLLNINSCSSSRDFRTYQGYIFNLNNIPISGLEVFEKDRPNNKAFTDKKGFFKMNKPKNSISMFLMIKNNKNLIDSIQVIRRSGGERINYYFIEGRSDTLFIKQK